MYASARLLLLVHKVAFFGRTEAKRPMLMSLQFYGQPRLKATMKKLKVVILKAGKKR